MEKFLISTGGLGNVRLDDLGYKLITDPTIDLDLLSYFTPEQISGSQTWLQSALDAGSLTAKNESGMSITRADAALNALNWWQLAKDDTTSSITGTLLWQQKLKMTTPVLPIGKYRIGWQMDYTADDKDSNKGFVFKVEIDDTTIINDSDGMGSWENREKWIPISGFDYVDFASAAAHTIDIDYAVLDTGRTAYIRRARLEIWRVL